MKTFSFLFIFVSMSVLTFAQDENSAKTLVKTLDPSGCQTIKLDLDAENIQAEPWDEGTMRIELEISANMPENILAQLIKAGRYALEADKDGTIYIVSAPNLGKTVTIRGTDLEEQITIHAKTPGYYALNDNVLGKDAEDLSTAVAARTDDPEKAKQMIEKMKYIQESLDVQVKISSTLSDEEKAKFEDVDPSEIIIK